jgi:AcrR family transcriptional regulator
MSSDDNTAQAPSRSSAAQLLDVAWQLVREEGTEGLSLGRLAEQAGVTKPVVYDHFETRTGLLVALYQEYDARQTAMLDNALAGSAADLMAGRR